MKKALILAVAIVLVAGVASGDAAVFDGMDFVTVDGYDEGEGRSCNTYAYDASDDTAAHVYSDSAMESKGSFFDGSVSIGGGGENNSEKIFDLEDWNSQYFDSQHRVWALDVDSATGDLYTLSTPTDDQKNNHLDGRNSIGVQRFTGTGPAWTWVGYAEHAPGNGLYDQSVNDLQIFDGYVYISGGEGNGARGVQKAALGFTDYTTTMDDIITNAMIKAVHTGFSGDPRSGGLTFDTDGNLYLANEGGMLKWDGTTLSAMPGAAGSETSRMDVEFYDGNLWVADGTQTINIYDLTGSLVDTYSLDGDADYLAFAAQLEGTGVVVPEPAGLGLLGVALLAMRKRRS